MRKAGDIITELFRENFGPEFMETARSNAGLFSSWKEIVTEVWPRADLGPEDIPAAAVHSRIWELERGLLLVEADHPGWIQILQTKQAEILAVVKRRYPELGIRGIAFRLSRDTLSAREEPAAPVREIRREPLPASHDAPRDEEFYAALKGLEESIKERNGL